MKHTALILLLAASTMAASAQAPAKPATAAAKPAVTAAKPAAPAAKPAVSAAKPAAAVSPSVAAVIKAPAGIPPVPGVQKPIFTVALRYQEIKIGTGAVAEPNKLYKVHYTGYRAADGVKFDSSHDHPGPPLKDKDGKPIMGDDGKPKMDVPQPMPFPQGMGGTIAGFDQGFAGMKVGGQRRIFIPWQLGYGTRLMPDRGSDHPGIPAKSDLIFDVELVDVSEMPQMPTRPQMGGTPQMPPGHPTTNHGMHPMPGAPAVQPPVPGLAPKPSAAPGTPAAPPATNAAPTPVPATAPAAPAAQPQQK
jgi:peptidylprolyl isomerase